MKKYTFVSAIPVWAENREKEKNLWLEFSTKISKSADIILALTGSCVYNVRINGNFIAFGPARCAHGFYRVDEINISEFLKQETNEIKITVAGYNINSFYTLDQPSFLCAEIISGGKVVAATGKSGFFCREVNEHEQKVGKYSYQRTFVEIYDLNEHQKLEIKAVPTEEKNFIYRGSALNNYPVIKAASVPFCGNYHMGNDERYE